MTTTTVKMVDKRYALLETPLDGNTMGILREIPVKKLWKERALKFELTRASLEYIREYFPEAVWDPTTKEFTDSIDLLIKEENTPRNPLELEIPPEAMSFRFKLKPMEHQLKAFLLSRDKEFFGFFMEMGTGKSKLGLDTAAYLHENGAIDNLLIIAPNNVHKQWVTEQIPIHLPDWVRCKVAYYRSSPNKEEKKALEELKEQTKNNNGTLRILSMNVESLSIKSGIDYALRFCMTGRTVCILDESSRIKNHKANRTQNIMKIRDVCDFRRIATGTSITKGIEDLFSQLQFLHRDILGFTSFYAFRNRYCIVKEEQTRDGKRFSKIVGYKRVDELKQKLATWTFEVKKEDCLDLPPKTYMERLVDLHPEQRKKYDQMRDELITQLSSGEVISAPLAITKMLRLQQIICGHLPSGDGKGYEVIPSTGMNPRLEAILEILDETNEQVIIWSRFIADIDQIAKMLGNRAVRYDGCVSEKDRSINIDLFKSGQRQVFVGNPQAAGIGLNLTEASMMIYYSNDFNAETRWQSEDRFHRIGQKKNVTIIDLVAPGTMDKKILAALKSKKSIAEMMSNKSSIKDFLEE